ncbi:hypothetical protein P175DRAFT_0497273 [Aspergillus ochraceoroseus IBT 24754]|nr:uncharacterized protein P175DRAFT_0497273 [Aspergillus ochraceoroseus IBT 24754]PTU24154.1 hypothetical protein P175DRAFT_0497273 [Aspergillus ochraceoroseus IBT 24754]
MAQAVGLTGAGWLAGNIASFSLVTAPALLQSCHSYQVPASLIVKQWRELYEKGKRQNPPIAASVAAAFAYLAWSVRQGTSLAPLAPRNGVALYSAAAVLTLGIVPWTLIAMTSTNKALLDRASATWVSTDKSNEEVEGLLEKWTVLNAIRSLFPLAGGIVGYLAL